MVAHRVAPHLSPELNVDVVVIPPRGGGAPPQKKGFCPYHFVLSLKTPFYFGLWYALNVYYNIVNKKLMNRLPLPVTLGTIQLLVGSIYVYFSWMTNIRSRPDAKFHGDSAVRSVGMYHGLGQIFSMVSMNAGSISFTHIVKALEPFFSAGVSAVVFKKLMNPVVYSTLIPVVSGVGIACLKDLSFTWLGFVTALGSNAVFACRAVFSKMILTSSNISAPNLYGLVTIEAFKFALPLVLLELFFSPAPLTSMWDDAVSASDGSTLALFKSIVFSGLFHYLNNEVMYLALNNVHPVTLAVGNTMKRVFIIVASVLVFQTQVSTTTAVGSTIGILGVLLYSLTKQHYEKLEAIGK